MTPILLHQALLPLLILTTPYTPTAAAAHRRDLHQPFYPLLSTPNPPGTAPPQPTTVSPTTTPPPPPPSSPPSTNNAKLRPFFPSYPPPPPPEQPSLPTFPANISSLSSSPSPRRSSPRRLAPLLAIPAAILLLAVIVITTIILLRRRHRHAESSSDSHRFFPPNSTASDGRKLSPSSSSAAAAPAAPPSTSDFLYLGTLVSSDASAPSTSTYQKLGSPELHPLPPLPRRARPRPHDGCAFSSDDEFYSPSSGSPSERRNAASVSTEKSAAAARKCSSSSISKLSSPSYPSSEVASSSSSPPIASSPDRPSIKSMSSGGTAFQPPPPPAPPRLLRPLKNPSPPKKRPFAVSNSSNSNPFTISPPPRRPPPPPPPPPPGYAVTPTRIGLPTMPSEANKYGAAIFPENSDPAENGKVRDRPKLKPLHWDKVRASSDREMVWHHLKSSSFELNEEMIATLFGYEAANAAETVRRQFGSSPGQENMVLDPKKAQNIAILLRALNVTKEEVCEALYEGNADSLGNELLETLLRMAPSKEEEIKLKEHQDDSPIKLGPAEKFLKAVVNIPFAFERVDAMLYISNFESDVNYLMNSFESLKAACGELRSSRMFLKLIEAVLKTGNRMNDGTSRGDAKAFKLDTLLKLVDVKGTDGKTTLLHFVVQEIIKAEGLRLFSANQSTIDIHLGSLQDDLECKKLGLQVVSGLGCELNNVKKAAGMDSDVLISCVSRLATDINKIREVLRLNSVQSYKEKSHLFHDAMSSFLDKAEDGITKLQAQETIAMSRVKEITVYFHGDSAKEEAHPLRIFMIVRDFLTILDQVCKEVGRINERTAISSMHSVSVTLSPTQSLVFPGLHSLRNGSSDDESLASL